MRKIKQYQRLSLEDQRKFDRWFSSSSMLSLIIAAGMLAMALAGVVSVVVDQAAQVVTVPTAEAAE
jgi:hypothetical protein